jgi:hypothetical protein
VVGPQADLGAGEGARLEPEGLQGHRQERDRHLLAGREQHVHLSQVWGRRDLAGERQETVGRLAHGGDHDDQLVAGRARRDATRYVCDLLRVGDGRSSELLDDQRHDFRSLHDARGHRKNRLQQSALHDTRPGRAWAA